jgi:hypothetical protein
MDCEALMQIGQTRDPERKDRMIADGYVIAYFFNEVLVGRWKDKKAVFVHEPQWDHLMEIHIFNKDEELRAVFSEDYAGSKNAPDGWLVRYRQDKDDKNHYDEDMMILNNGKPSDEGTEDFKDVTEAGRHVIMPKEAWNKKLRVRNYLTFGPVDDDKALPPLNAMRIGDYRFVDFVE